MEHGDDQIATKESWKIVPIPTTRADLGFTESYTPEEFARIKRGLLPQQMEDKWFIYFDEPWLYLCRSWTGFHIYGIRFEPRSDSICGIESWVSRDKDQYTETRIDYDLALVTFLIDRFLLRKEAQFPVKADAASTGPKGIYQHHMVGRAFPEKPVPGPIAKNSIWNRIQKLFGYGTSWE